MPTNKPFIIAKIRLSNIFTIILKIYIYRYFEQYSYMLFNKEVYLIIAHIYFVDIYLVYTSYLILFQLNVTWHIRFAAWYKGVFKYFWLKTCGNISSSIRPFKIGTDLIPSLRVDWDCKKNTLQNEKYIINVSNKKGHSAKKLKLDIAFFPWPLFYI